MTLPSSKQSSTVGELLGRRLREVNRSAEQLAEVAQVPPEYIDDLISGSRRAPLPARTDIYEKMTSFLRLGRNDLISCARSERASAAMPAGVGPEAGVRRLLLDLCEPATAKVLERRQGRRSKDDLVDFIQRLLDITQGAVRRLLDDQFSLRLAAVQRGISYEALRLSVLEFLDATPETLTIDDVTKFVQPRIARWDVDLETRVLRVALRTQEPRDRGRRGLGETRPAGVPDVEGEG
jgi:hypothetical protein